MSIVSVTCFQKPNLPQYVEFESHVCTLMRIVYMGLVLEMYFVLGVISDSRRVGFTPVKIVVLGDIQPFFLSLFATCN